MCADDTRHAFCTYDHESELIAGKAFVWLGENCPEFKSTSASAEAETGSADADQQGQQLDEGASSPAVSNQ